MELKGKTALITGSTGSGIGRSAAFRLASDGANIILNHGPYHRTGHSLKDAADGANRVVKVVEELGGKALILPADTVIQIKSKRWWMVEWKSSEQSTSWSFSGFHVTGFLYSFFSLFLANIKSIFYTVI